MTHTCMVGDNVCQYCIILYPSNYEELGTRVWRDFDDEQRRVNGDHVWLKARVSGGSWRDDPKFWKSTGVMT